MSKKQQLIAALSILALFIGLFLYRQQPVVLRLGVFAGSAWDVPSPRSYEILDSAIERFEASHPGVQVEYDSGILKEDYSAYLADQLAAGKAPDVFMILPEDFDLFCSIDALQPLDQLMHEGKVAKDKFYASALSAGQFDGWQYALPFESNVDLLFVNTSLLAQEGIVLPDQMSLEDFYEICRRVTKDTNGDGRMDQFGICDYTWKHAADAYGLQLFSDTGSSITLSGQPVKQVLDMTRKFDALCQDARKGEKGLDPFSKGKAAFAVMSFADYRTYTPYPWKIKRLSSFDWTVIPLPGGKDAVAEVQTIEMGISSSTKDLNKSWQLLSTLCLDPEIQQLHYTCSQGISALKTANKPVLEDSEVDYSILEQVMIQPVRQARFSNYASALEMTNREMENILSSTSNQEALLMQAESRINRYLNK